MEVRQLVNKQSTTVERVYSKEKLTYLDILNPYINLKIEEMIKPSIK
jgi:fructose-1,6-bisphosphatase